MRMVTGAHEASKRACESQESARCTGTTGVLKGLTTKVLLTAVSGKFTNWQLQLVQALTAFI